MIHDGSKIDPGLPCNGWFHALAREKDLFSQLFKALVTYPSARKCCTGGPLDLFPLYTIHLGESKVAWAAARRGLHVHVGSGEHSRHNEHGKANTASRYKSRVLLASSISTSGIMQISQRSG